MIEHKVRCQSSVTGCLLKRESIRFISEDGDIFDVSAENIRPLNDRGVNAWSIKGVFQMGDGEHWCSVRFSERSMTGLFTDYGPVDRSHTLEYLDALGLGDLNDRKATGLKVTGDFKSKLDEYVKGLTPHDRLVVEVYTLHELGKLFLEIEFQHQDLCTRKTC